MPAEGAPHERTWLAWPTTGYTLGSDPASAEEARRTWAAVANAVAEFEPVSVMVDPRAARIAPRYLSGEITLHVADLDDAWARDSGPTFVVRDDPQAASGQRLGAVDWVFNGWGGQEWASWDNDALLAPIIAGLAGAELIPSTLVNEGGGIHVDGEGTVLLTDTVQLDPGRNPGLGRADVEAELARTIGASTPIWLPRGLTRDSEAYGTRGHVDIVATFAAPGRVLLHAQLDERHPDFAVTRDIRARLAEATDAAGRTLEVIDVPAPTTLRDAGGWVDYSYINHLLVNGGVIACAFGDERDEAAAALLADAYPGRRVVSVDARPLFERGGGIHCITQQQPGLAGA
jgi:agmatine deiminase